MAIREITRISAYAKINDKQSKGTMILLSDRIVFEPKNSTKLLCLQFENLEELNITVGTEKLNVMGIFKKEKPSFRFIYNKKKSIVFITETDSIENVRCCIKSELQRIAKEKARQERLRQEEERKRQEELRRQAEERRKRQEELRRQAVEKIKRQEELRRQAEEKQRKQQKEQEDLENLPDEPQKNEHHLKNIDKRILASFFENPYRVLGISCKSTKSEALNIKDKIEKLSRLNIAQSYKSKFDLKYLTSPIREISVVQNCIMDLEDIKHKWFWFADDKYSKIWEGSFINEWLENVEVSDDTYDLFVATYMRQLIKEESLEVVFKYLNKLLSLPNKKLINILKSHGNIDGKMAVSDDNILQSFKNNIMCPINMIIEYGSLNMVEMLLKKLDFKKYSALSYAQESLYDSVVIWLNKKCNELNACLKEIEEYQNASQNERGQVYEKAEMLIKCKTLLIKYIDWVGGFGAYENRLKKKYKDTLWEATNFFDEVNQKKISVKCAKQIYYYCDNKDKKVLRNVYGYEALGLTEESLEPDEMKNLGISYAEGDGVTQNNEKAIYWLTKAAKLGDAIAQTSLALKYYAGELGLPCDKSQSKYWFKKAAAQGNEVAIDALQNLFGVPHEHYDLGYVSVNYSVTKLVEVELTYRGYVRLLDDLNYSKYINGDNYRYYGGFQTQTPCTIKIPQSDHWHVVVDNDGDELGGITSTCSTRTISNY